MKYSKFDSKRPRSEPRLCLIIWILANLRYRTSDVRYRIIPIFTYDIVGLVVRYRTRTISYTYDIVRQDVRRILYVKTYDIDVRYRILGTYDIATYDSDIVRLTYDVVYNLRCRIFHIRCRMLQIVCDIIRFGQHIVRSRLHIVCYIAYDIVYDISIDLIWGIRNSKLNSILASLLHTCASASTTMLFNN